MKSLISKSPAELSAKINNELMNFLKSDLKKYIFETQQKHIHEDVYSYVATDYAMKKRRKNSGGLSDIQNMNVILNTSKGSALYVNNTPPQMSDFNDRDISLAEAVEIGSADWNMNVNVSGNGPGPRPFMKNTLEEIKNNDKTYIVFRDFFKKKGIKTIKL